MLVLHVLVKLFQHEQSNYALRVNRQEKLHHCVANQRSHHQHQCSARCAVLKVTHIPDQQVG